MQWHQSPKGQKRLSIETAQMERYSQFQLYEDDETENLIWCGQLISHGHLHKDVRLVYDENHPYVHMKVFVLQPKLPSNNHHIFSDGSICYESGEWSAQWTALTVLLTTMRFLDEFYRGTMDNERLPRRPPLDAIQRLEMLKEYLGLMRG